MKNYIKKIMIALFSIFLLIPMVCNAEPPKPNGVPGGNASISYKGATKINSTKTYDNKTFKSTKGGVNSILVTGGNSTLNNCKINKFGNESNENSDFYGTNAGILVKSGILNISDSDIITNGTHANGVFSYNKGTINISDSNITTKTDNSGGVMVTGGGSLNANNLAVSTQGNSSAAIRSDRGGGNLVVNKGSYKTSGMGSPAIYSTAKITVSDAELTSLASEGVVIEGANSVLLDNTKLVDTNNTLNGNSETYKNIFLYQSMSGDAKSGPSSFTAKNSNIITNKGDTIFVTNTTAIIELDSNTIINNDGDFLRIQKGKWGNSGSNGGKVTLNLKNQKVFGNVIVDKISTLDMDLKNNSVLKGAINTDNSASKLTLTLSKNSTLVLTGDSYITSLANEINDNQNIYLNGYSLYVNGEKVKANEGSYLEKNTNKGNNQIVQNDFINYKKYVAYLLGVLAVILIIIVIITIKKRTKKKRNIIDIFFFFYTNLRLIKNIISI